MKVSVDRNECLGNAQCVMAAPDLFELRDDEDQVSVLQEEVPAELEDDARYAVNLCPVQALLLS
jgi:ferredoxin